MDDARLWRLRWQLEFAAIVGIGPVVSFIALTPIAIVIELLGHESVMTETVYGSVRLLLLASYGLGLIAATATARRIAVANEAPSMVGFKGVGAALSLTAIGIFLWAAARMSGITSTAPVSWSPAISFFLLLILAAHILTALAHARFLINHLPNRWSHEQQPRTAISTLAVIAVLASAFPLIQDLDQADWTEPGGYPQQDSVLTIVVALVAAMLLVASRSRHWKK